MQKKTSNINRSTSPQNILTGQHFLWQNMLDNVVNSKKTKLF
uniref:Uncharacterized protein n=1 Tax=Arundo donax TaxID=35708 RepID=A0A0A8XY65_ARUDO